MTRTSAIVCAAGRSPWLAEAVGSVLAQTDADLELLLVLDHDRELPQLPHDSRIAVVRSDPGCGAARDAGLRAARGEFVAFCDDDDEWSEDHLEVLHAALAETSADLVYGDSVVRSGEASGGAWSRDVDVVELAHSNYVFASDVLARRDALRAAGGFDSALRCYEDWDLWLRLSLTGRLHHVPLVLGTRRWHDDALLAYEDWDVWQKVFERHRQRVEALGLRGRLAVRPDGLRHERFLPETWAEGRRQLAWQSRLSSGYGYGLVGRQLLRAVQRAGVEVLLVPSRDQVPSDLLDLDVVDDHWGRLAFYYDLPGDPGSLPAERVASYFMWESEQLPARFVERINRYAALQLVPCQDNLESFRRSGVDVQMAVLRHGIDPNRFPLLDRPERDVFTFGSFSDLSPRKGIDVLLRAFSQEFSPSEPVRLVLKGGAAAVSDLIDHPGVTVSSSFLDDSALQEWLRGLDAFVLPSRGEGFGLTGLEAMATGLPLIATAWSGPKEYLDPADSYPLAYELLDPGPRVSAGVRFEGRWAEPDVDELRRLLRHLVEHRDEARMKGAAASRRVHRSWTWDHAAAELVGHLDRLAEA